jgi:hypothetical protein
MRLEKPTCPECGQPAVFVSEYQPVFAEIHVTEDGDAEYTGIAEENTADGREPELDSCGQSCVACREYHFWMTYIN